MVKKNLIAKIAFRFIGIALLALLLGRLAAPIQASTHPGPPDPLELEAFFDSTIAEQLKSLHIPGAAVTVVGNGEVLFAKGYGFADLEQQTPMDAARTLFRTGSVAKLLTWTAVMQLAEQGRLDLNADINDYLDFTIPATFPEPITLAHLMTHTPGFEDVPEELFVYTAEEVRPLDGYLKHFVPMRVFPPGKVIAYSNYGTALAGYIVERVSGESFDLYVENHILTPLGMHRSTFRQPLPQELAGDMASGYNFHNDSYVKGGFLFAVPYPAGAMSAPVTEMAPFMLAHLQEGRYGSTSILQPATVEEMHRRQYTTDPRLTGMAYGFIEQNINGYRILHHSGSTFQFNSALYLLPEENLGIYVSYNGLAGIEATKLLWQAFMDRFYPAPPLPQLAAPAGAAERITAYTGEYHLARAQFNNMGSILRMLDAAQVGATPEGDLLLTVAGRTEPYTELEPGIYHHQSRNEMLGFHTDEDGIVWLSLDGNPAFVSFTATSAFRAPWYATLPVGALLILSTLLLFVISIIGWLIVALRSWRQGAKLPLPARLARWTATFFGLIFLFFLVGLVSVVADMDPAYEMPRMVFREPPIVGVIAIMPWLLGVVALGQALFTGMAWRGVWNERQPYWRLWGRIHYTALTLMAFVLLLWMWYWNFLW
jgi:CubicO group peptidase (beta-lactamase class C family)